MKTEVIMYRPFFDFQIRQMSKSEFFCITDLVDAYNKMRILEGKSSKELADYFKNKSSQEFMEELCNELNSNENSKQGISPVYYIPSDLKIIKRGKHNKGTWGHPYLFVDIAMWLSPEFRVKAVMWVTDNLLLLRNNGGDAFKSLNRTLDMTFNIGKNVWEYPKVAKLVQRKVFGIEGNDLWNSATKEQLAHRERVLVEIESAAKYGNFKTLKELLDAVKAGKK